MIEDVGTREDNDQKAADHRDEEHEVSRNNNECVRAEVRAKSGNRRWQWRCWGLRSPRKESGTCQIREGILGMEAEEETALYPKTYKLESPGEETEHMTHKLVRDSAASKQYTESPHSRLH